MSFSPEVVEPSYAACRRLARQAHSNLRIGFVFLSPDKRRAMDALYAFMRHSDDLVDACPPGERAGETLAWWRGAMEATLACEGPSMTGPAADLLPALADTVRRFRIPLEYLRAVLDGVEMDLRQPRYETFEDLEKYCERVASAVGLACIHIWGFRGPQALEPARKAGLALQLTNILRDLKEDARADRVYLPLTDLRQCGYSVEELQRGVVNPAFLRLMGLEIGRAEQFYREADDLLPWLHRDGRRIFGIMTATYRRLLAKIKSRPGEVFLRRMRVGWIEKLGIAARWML